MTRPTHKLCMKPGGANKEKWSEVGAGWEKENETGRWFSIRLNRGVVLNWRDMEDMKLALFEVK